MTAPRSVRRPPFPLRPLLRSALAALSIAVAAGLPARAAEPATTAVTAAVPAPAAATPAAESPAEAPRAAARPPATPPNVRGTIPRIALKSNAALVVDQDTGELLVLKNPDLVVPIASLTKLMTALVVLDARLPLDETLQISSDDIDTERNTHSRLTVGTRLRRQEMLLLALMSSENRAAMALSRNYPGGRPAFIAQMNRKAQSLGMRSTHFADPAGLSNDSVSTARDLHRLLGAAYAQPLIRRFSTQPEDDVVVNGRTLHFISSNRLVRGDNDWDIELQKTGFTNEAGRCLVMQVNLLRRRLAMIFLDSAGTMTRYADAARVRREIEVQARNLQRRLPGPAAALAASH